MIFELIKEPSYFYRNYINDFPQNNNVWIETGKKIACFAIPFFSLYQPLALPLSLGMGSLRVLSKGAEVLSCIQNNQETFTPLLQTAISATALFGTTFAHPIGMAITTANDLTIEMANLSDLLNQGKNEEALASCLKVINHLLHFTLFLHSGIELSIVFLIFQILIGFYNSKEAFQKKNRLECAGHLLMTLVRSYQLSAAVSLYAPTSVVGRTSNHLSKLAEKVTVTVLGKIFRAGYVKFPDPIAQERREQLIREKGAQPLECKSSNNENIDVLYIPSSSPQATGNAVVFALNTTYQDLHPRNIEPFLNNGSDVVLWNQTDLTSVQYEKDLSSVLQTLRAQNPTQSIAIKSRCASVDPAIAAVSTQNDPRLSLILESGWGNTPLFARSFTILSKIPFIQRIIQEKFTCHGDEKITSIPGKVLILAPSARNDQLMHLGNGKNLTHQLHQQCPRSEFFELQDSDHWSRWGYETYNRVYKFLSENHIFFSTYTPATAQQFPSPSPLSFYERVVIPFLSKAWC